MTLRIAITDIIKPNVQTLIIELPVAINKSPVATEPEVLTSMKLGFDAKFVILFCFKNAAKAVVKDSILKIICTGNNIAIFCFFLSYGYRLI